MTEYYKLEPVDETAPRRAKKNRAFFLTLAGVAAVFAITITTTSVLQDRYEPRNPPAYSQPAE